MRALNERIRRDGKNLGGGILKVDSFINHQVDPILMMTVGQALAARFFDCEASKVLTAEISGIAPALTTALALQIPVVYARKTKPVTMHPGAINANGKDPVFFKKNICHLFRIQSPDAYVTNPAGTGRIGRGIQINIRKIPYF